LLGRLTDFGAAIRDIYLLSAAICDLYLLSAAIRDLYLLSAAIRDLCLLSAAVRDTYFFTTRKRVATRLPISVVYHVQQVAILPPREHLGIIR
jgi:hypothetical protein